MEFGSNEVAILFVFLAMIIGLLKTPLNLRAYETTLPDRKYQAEGMTEIFQYQDGGVKYSWTENFGEMARFWLVPVISMALSSFILFVIPKNALEYSKKQAQIRRDNGSFKKGGVVGVTVGE